MALLAVHRDYRHLYALSMAKHWNKDKLHPLSVDYHAAAEWERLVLYMTCEKLGTLNHEPDTTPVQKPEPDRGLLRLDPKDFGQPS